MKINNVFKIIKCVEELFMNSQRVFTFLLILSFGIFLFSCAKQEEYTIYFDSNGGSEVNPITTNGKTIDTMPGNPTKDGFIFSGWFWDDTTFTNSFTIVSLLDIELNSNMTVYAKWIEDSSFNPIKSFIVSFDSMGGSQIDPIDVQENSTTVIPEVTKDGYSLEGWYTSINGGETFDEKWSITTSLVQSEITLYAKWNPNFYRIDYYSVGWDKLTDFQLNFGETISSISLGKDHTSALTSSGRLFTWGYNRYGQVGDGTETIVHTSKSELNSQFDLAINETVAKMSMGEYHSAALTSTGRLFTWGLNSSGQLGNGMTAYQNYPIEITSKFNLGIDETISSISLGKDHTSALTSMGRLFMWGENTFGQLGDGTNVTTYKSDPKDITSQFNLEEGEKLISVSLGGKESSVLTSMGRLFTWGYNEYGQLGDGTTIDKTTPTEITSNFDLNEGETIADISLGFYHSSALTSMGRLFTWGYNEYAQLGDGETINKTTPTDITNRFNLTENEMIVDVSLGGEHSSALTSEGNIFTWGRNDNYQTGDDSIDSVDTPIQITSRFNLHPDEKIISAELGFKFTGVLTSEGRFFTWGYDWYGQLGGEIRKIKYLPAEIIYSHADLKSIQTINYEFASAITEYVPVLEGYTFSGWYSDTDLTLPYTFTTMPANDIALYCRWIPNE